MLLICPIISHSLQCSWYVQSYHTLYNVVDMSNHITLSTMLLRSPIISHSLRVFTISATGQVWSVLYSNVLISTNLLTNILSNKPSISKLRQGFHFSCDTKFHVFSRLFPGKGNEIQGQFGFESVFVLIM